MKVVLIRHFKVIAKRNFFLTASQFDEDRKRYDEAEIYPSEFKLNPSDFPHCYASPKKRAVETAMMIYAGRVEIKEELVEVMNAGVFLKLTSMPSILRSIIGRIAWYFNMKGMPETRAQSIRMN
jgi:hypothetical protein